VEVAVIDFSAGQPNRLMINPKMPEVEKQVLAELQKHFENKVKDKDYFLIPSSGSSKKNDQSVKLIALSLEAILNSAQRFNNYFTAQSSDHWGLVLPEFHVAGLGVYARAHLSGASVFRSEWSAEKLEVWIEDNKICFISLVPAQVFDLVKLGVPAPPVIKKIFVGAGSLDKELQERAVSLKWPVVETYGMTETASMIAVRQNSELFEVLPSVEVKIEQDILSIQCSSLLSAVLQKDQDTIILQQFAQGQWYQTEDLATITKSEGKNWLNFLGRKTDYTKILGEGVSLSEIRNRIEKILMSQGVNPQQVALLAVNDERAGSKLVLVVQSPLTESEVKRLLVPYHQLSRPYEKVTQIIEVRQIPRTDLGKLKAEELKSIIGL
jgi:o-succinylbenzoate---CoA ligase